MKIPFIFIMGNILALQKALSSIKLTSVIADVVDENEPEIIRLQKEQLLEGKANDNEDLRPYYSEDPYFKKPGAGERYAAWKAEITPNSKRNKDAPNLIITGKFHGEIELSRSGDEFNITTGSFGNKVTSKFTKALGINEDSKIKFKPTLLNETLETIRERLEIN